MALSVLSEAQSRNKHFMDEIEFFVTDVMATIALNGFVLTMLSPAATLGRTPGGGGALALVGRPGGALNDFLRLLMGRGLTLSLF